MQKPRRLLARFSNFVILCLLLCGGQPAIAQIPSDSPAGSLMQADSHNVVLPRKNGHIDKGKVY